MTKSAQRLSWSFDLHGCSRGGGEFFLTKYIPEGCTVTHKRSFFPYKQVNGRNDDHEWLRMTNAFMLCDLLWNVQKNHAANREGSFKNSNQYVALIFVNEKDPVSMFWVLMTVVYIYRCCARWTTGRRGYGLFFSILLLILLLMFSSIFNISE